MKCESVAQQREKFDKLLARLGHATPAEVEAALKAREEVAPEPERPR